MRLQDFKALTFDCYGTLIDWESGILAAFGPWRKRTGVTADDNRLLELFAEAESLSRSPLESATNFNSCEVRESRRAAGLPNSAMLLARN